MRPLLSLQSLMQCVSLVQGLSPQHFALTTAGASSPCSLHTITVRRTTLILACMFFFPFLSLSHLVNCRKHNLSSVAKLSGCHTFSHFNLHHCCCCCLEQHWKHVTCNVSLLWMCCSNIIFQVPAHRCNFQLLSSYMNKNPQHANNHRDYRSLVVIQCLSGGELTVSVPTLDHNYVTLTHISTREFSQYWDSYL